MKKIFSILIVLTIYFLNIVLAQSWTQLGSDIDGKVAGDYSGRVVSLSGDGKRVVIGSHANGDNGEYAGQARIYSESGGTWTQVGSDLNGEVAGETFGEDVSISADGKRVAIGVIYHNYQTGCVRVYSEAGGVWTQLGSDIDGEAFGDNSGESVSISADGKRVAIGAFLNDGAGDKAGHVRVYSESGGVWTQVGSDLDGEAANDFFGNSVSLSSDGKRIAIGANFNDGAAENAGHARVYSESGGAWTQVGTDIDGKAADDRSGFSVSLSENGKCVAIGASWNNDGYTRVFSESGGVWTQVGSDINGEAANDHSGQSVSISADGTVVAIGAHGNNGNGLGSGHVRVYSESGGVWTQVGTDIDGEAAGDASGYSVSLSDFGDRIAIGAIINNGNGELAGHTRIYHTYALDVTDHENSNSLPNNLTLLPAYPNPFNPSTTLTYGIEKDSRVTISIYDINGNLITELLNTEQNKGWHSVVWKGTNISDKQVPAGIYISKITSNNTTKTNKLMLLK